MNVRTLMCAAHLDSALELQPKLTVHDNCVTLHWLVEEAKWGCQMHSRVSFSTAELPYTHQDELWQLQIVIYDCQQQLALLSVWSLTAELLDQRYPQCQNRFLLSPYQL